MLCLRSHLYRHLSKMLLRWFTANRTGETLSRLSNDVGSIQGVMSETLGSVLGNSITLVITFIFILLFVIPARRVGNLQRNLQRETQEQLGTLNSQMQETLSVSGALLMKTFGRQEDEATLFENTAREIRRLSIRRAMIGRWFGLAMG